MKKPFSTKSKKILIIAGITALSLLFIYLTYASIGAFYGWQQQPLFTNGIESSRSYGFFVVGCVYTAFAVIDAVLTFLLVYFTVIRPKKALNDTPTATDNDNND